MCINRSLSIHHEPDWIKCFSEELMIFLSRHSAAEYLSNPAVPREEENEIHSILWSNITAFGLFILVLQHGPFDR
jgi:hypothetical protein